MKFSPETIQGKITASLIAALVLVVIACFSGIGENFQNSGIMMRLFLVFFGAIVVGTIFALQVIPGLITIEGMMRGISTLTRRKQAGGADDPGDKRSG